MVVRIETIAEDFNRLRNTRATRSNPETRRRASTKARRRYNYYTGMHWRGSGKRRASRHAGTICEGHAVLHEGL